jgi:pimeloyl-ACP methyl ester carboxylesterase
MRGRCDWLMLTLLLAGLNVYAQRVSELKLEPYVFEAANKEKVDAELGHLFVPEIRRNPNSKLIELVFVRFKSTSPNPGPPIVYLAGGPGTSGIASARGARFPVFQAMREIGDVIALDQRGVGLSKPNMNCRERVTLSPDTAHQRAAVLEAFRQQARACAASFRAQGVDLAGYNTNENAADIEALRQALGAPKISLWAISYGTHLASAVIRRYEKKLHRVILAGVEGPAHTIKLPSNTQKHLAQISQMVKADASLNAEIPDLLALMKSVLERVEKEPVVVEVNDPTTSQQVKVTLTKFALQYLTANLFGGNENLLPRNYYILSKGDFSAVAQLWLRTLRAGSGASAMASMMDCYSGISPQRRQQIAREAKESLLGDIMDFPFPDVCDAWGNPDLGEAFRLPLKSNVPALFISGTFDVRTPVSNAEEIRRGFRTSSHLIIEGAVHSDPLFVSSPRIKDVLLEFMRGQPLSTTRITLLPLRFVQLPKSKGAEQGRNQ